MLDPTLCNYLFIHCFASSFILYSWKFKHQFIFPEKTQPINNPNCNTIKCNYTYEPDPKVGRTWFVFFFIWVSARYNRTNNSHCFLTHAVHWSMLYPRGSKWGQCCPQATFANVWIHFVLSQLGERGQYYDLVSRGQWQDSLPWIIQPQMSTVGDWEILLYPFQNNLLRDEYIYTFAHNLINIHEYTEWIRNLSGINSCSCAYYSQT